MSRRGKRRSRPMPDANIKQIVTELEKTLTVEDKYKNDLLGLEEREDALVARDGAVQNLRFVKFWLELPSGTFLLAVALLDRFLTKMKVREKYLPCVSISCLYVASEIHKIPIDRAALIDVSQTKCSVNDIERMCDIIRKKLNIDPSEQPITVYSYLNLFLRTFEGAAIKLNVKPLSSRMLQKNVLLRHLEVVMSSYVCASVRYPVIVLALIQYEIEKFLAAEIPSKSTYYSLEMFHLLTIVFELQSICMVKAGELHDCFNSVKDVLKKYDNYMKTEMKQKMNWRFSVSTATSPRPLDLFRTNLSKISEEA